MRESSIVSTGSAGALGALFEVESQRLAPLERQRRRAAHRNFTNLYYRTSSGTGQRMMSMYSDSVPFPVLSAGEWWGEGWSAAEFARPVELGKPFFDNYSLLKQAVPHVATLSLNSENCDYSNAVMNSRNCYLCFGCVKSADCLYSHIVWSCENCVDCLYSFESQWCSHCVDVVGCYSVHYSTEAVNCSESYFLHDCKSCSECFGCVNLRGARYCWFNQQLTKEAYQAKLSEVLPLKRGMIDKYQARLAQQRSEKAFYPALFESQTEAVSGNHLYFSKDCYYSFDLKRSESCRYCFTGLEVEHCQDLSFVGIKNRFCLEGLTLSGCERVLASHYLSDCSDCAYSEFCFNSKHLFGCNGLRNAEYCIFNQAYPRAEYFELRSKLVDQMRRSEDWGEFFPGSLSPFSYNESVAGEYTPLTETECVARGLHWKDLTDSRASGVRAEGLLDSRMVPECISETADSILGLLYRCPVTGGGVRYSAAELDFYRRAGIALPLGSFASRHRARLAMRQPRELVETACLQCGTPLQAAPVPNRANAEVGRSPLCLACYVEVVRG